ncbi:MAG: glycosyltransferase family 4 protein, partial [Bacteroidota bacterium]
TGNANVRAALSGLHDASLLDSYYTTIATYPGNIYSLLGKTGPFSDFQRRAFSPELASATHGYPWYELARLLSSKLGLRSLVKHETGTFSVDAVYRSLDRHVAKRLSSNTPRAVYAYEDGAATTFSEAGDLNAMRLYDLPIGYWRAARRLLGAVAEERPAWANTIKGMIDSPEKLARKDQELLLADHIFVASSFTAKTLNEFPGKLAPVQVIPYGFPSPVMDRTYEPLTNRPLRLLFVGGLSQRKGIAEMFEAIAQFGQRVELTIVGGKPTENCRPLNEALAKHRYIPSLPHQEILSLMRTQDVFLFPSHFEGFGLVITESMSQGTPVITTERTAGPDLITHGQDGYLIPAGSVNSLAEQIEYLLSHPQEIEKTGRAAINRAGQRPWSAYGNELAQAVSALLN